MEQFQLIKFNGQKKNIFKRIIVGKTHFWLGTGYDQSFKRQRLGCISHIQNGTTIFLIRSAVLPGTLSTDAKTERCTVGSLLPRRDWS